MNRARPALILASTARKAPPRPRRSGADPCMPRSVVEEGEDEVVAVLGVDPPGVVGAVARGAEAERHDGDDLVGVVDEHRPARVTEAGSAAASNFARVVQGMQVAALCDVAVDLDDARGRLVPRLHVHRLWLYGLDAVPHVLDQGVVTALASVAGQLLGGTQGRELTEGRDGSGLVQLDDAHVVVDREPGEVV